MKKMNKRQVLAWIGIIILALLYLSNLILALSGSDFAKQMLKVSVICTIAIPIILYGFLMVMKATGADQKIDIVMDEDEVIEDDVMENDVTENDATEEDDKGEA